MRKAYFVGKGLNQKEIKDLSEIDETTKVTVQEVPEVSDIADDVCVNLGLIRKELFMELVLGLIDRGSKVFAVKLVKDVLGCDLNAALSFVNSLASGKTYTNYEIFDGHEWVRHSEPKTIDQIENILLQELGVCLNGVVIRPSYEPGGYDVITIDGTMLCNNACFGDAFSAFVLNI